MIQPTNFCAVCSMPIASSAVHQRWHEREEQRFSQLVAALNATVSGVNRLTMKMDRLRRRDEIEVLADR